MTSSSGKDITLASQDARKDFLCPKQNKQFMLDAGNDDKSTILEVPSEVPSGNQINLPEAVKEEAIPLSGQDESDQAGYHCYREHMKDPDDRKCKDICVHSSNISFAHAGSATSDCNHGSGSFRCQTMEADDLYSKINSSLCPRPMDADELSVETKKENHHSVLHANSCHVQISTKKLVDSEKESRLVGEVLSHENEESTAGGGCVLLGQEGLQDSELASHGQLSQGKKPAENEEERFQCHADETVVEDVKPVVRSFQSMLDHLNSPTVRAFPELQSKNLLECFVKLERLQECSVCRLIVPSYTELKEHINIEHAGHAEGRNLEAYKCHHCGVKCWKKVHLDAHMLKEHLKEGVRAKRGIAWQKGENRCCKCAECGNEYKNKKQLAKHKRTKHFKLKKNQCVKCHEIFKTWSLLAEHASTNTCCTCPQCGLDYESKLQLYSHVYKKHNKLKENECAKCNKIFETLNLLDEHKAEDTCSKCFECGKNFQSKRHLYEHKQTKHFKSTGALCTKCGKIFDTIGLLAEHKAENTCCKCSECGREWKNKNQLANHECKMLLELKEKQCQKCDKIFETSSLLMEHKAEDTCYKSRKRHKLKENQCAKCDKIFETSSLFMKHKAEDRCYQCQECSQKYKHKKGLCDHVFRKHRKLKENQCAKCDKIFETLSLLFEHEAEDSCSKCPECFKTLPHKSRIRTHIKQCHQSEESHKCPHCPAEYKVYSGLKTHLRKHTGERPYVCPICHYAFFVKDGLQRHMKTHNREEEYNSVCDMCGSRFVDKHALARHCRVHTGEKPFKCHLCSSAHSTQSALKIHIRTHTGEKPYMCSECGRGYIAYSCLKSHMQNHHGTALKISK